MVFIRQNEAIIKLEEFKFILFKLGSFWESQRVWIEELPKNFSVFFGSIRHWIRWYPDVFAILSHSAASKGGLKIIWNKYIFDSYIIVQSKYTFDITIIRIGLTFGRGLEYSIRNGIWKVSSNPFCFQKLLKVENINFSHVSR